MMILAALVPRAIEDRAIGEDEGGHLRLVLEHFAQCGEHLPDSGVACNAEPPHEALLVERTQLVEQNKPVTSPESYRNSIGRRTAASCHRSNRDRAQKIMHFRWRNDWAGSRLLNFGTDGRVESSQPNFSTSDLDPVRSSVPFAARHRPSHQSRRSSSLLGNSGQTSASSPASAIAFDSSAQPAR